MDYWRSISQDGVDTNDIKQSTPLVQLGIFLAASENTGWPGIPPGNSSPHFSRRLRRLSVAAPPPLPIT